MQTEQEEYSSSRLVGGVIALGFLMLILAWNSF